MTNRRYVKRKKMQKDACGILINGNHTDIVAKVYSNRIFLIITQYKKLGSLVTVSREACLNQFDSEIFSTKIIFGKDDVEIHAASRYIAEQINIDRPLLLSICLKDYEVETLKAIVKAVLAIKSWGK